MRETGSAGLLRELEIRTGKGPSPWGNFIDLYSLTGVLRGEKPTASRSQAGRNKHTHPYI